MRVSQAHKQFLAASASTAFDLQQREVIDHAFSVYNEAFSKGSRQFLNLRLARQRAGLLRHMVLEHLEEHLRKFEQKFTENGGRIIWAETAADANAAILALFRENGVRQVVKAKSMVTEEIGLSRFLMKNGIECMETDLGEYIVQVAGDRPYHLVLPALHLTRKEIAAVFHEQFGLSEEASAADIMAFVRDDLRKKFAAADAGITGANFLVADTGSVAITENEGNGVLSMSVPRLHLVVTGIEKLIASAGDLDLFWPLLATHGTGQPVAAYNTLVGGPRRPDEKDGPEQMVVVLVDNGRSRLLSALPQRRALSCIRCGACLNACPVYRCIGGHAYGTVYTGPIGAVVSPFMTNKYEEYRHLSFASTLCGKCTEVCPVGIDLHHQLLMNRRLGVQRGHTARAERWAFWAYKYMMQKRRRLDALSPARKNRLFRRYFARGWGERREPPAFVKSFARRWR